LILISALTYYDNLESSSLFGVLPLIAKEFHLSDFLVGNVSSADTISTLLLTIPLAIAADRLPRTYVIGLGVVTWSLSTALCGLAGSFISLFLIRLLCGIGFASYDAPTNSLLCDLFPAKDRSWVMSVQAAALPVGAIMGTSVAAILGQYFGWRWAFVTIAIPGIVLGLLMCVLREPQRGAYDAGAPPSLKRFTKSDIFLGAQEILSSRGMIFGTLGRGIQSFSLVGIGSFLALFLERYYRISNGLAGTILSFVYLGVLLGTVPGGSLDSWLLKRFAAGSRFIVAGGATLFAGLLFAAALTLPFYSLVILSIASGCCLGATIAPLNTMVSDVVVPERRSYAFSLQGLAAGLTGLIAAPLVGAFSDLTHNLRLALLLLTFPLIVAGLLLLVTYRTQQREAEALQTTLQQRTTVLPIDHALSD
jgi:MFS transporter, Spinster family, sphingosine-1-phosphate transporter